MDKLDTLYEVCEAVMEELEKASEKLEKSGGEMTAGDIDYLDKLTHTLKSIKTTIAMEEADGDYSSDNYGRGSSNRSSYARRRDNMGRYSRNSYARGRGRGYSREDAKDDMMEHLHDMKMDAKDAETRRMVDRWIRQIEEG